MLRKNYLHVETTTRCTLKCPACPRTVWQDLIKQPIKKTDINLDDLPMNLWIKKNGYYDFGLNGGDDYQLILTAPKKNRIKINKLNALPSIKLSRIGAIKKGSKLNIIDSDGKPYKMKIKGFVHFAS